MCALIVRTLLQAPVFQLVIGSLTCRENFVLRQCDIICDMIVVCAVVGDIQFAVAVDTRRVWLCFASGVVKELGLLDDINAQLAAINQTLEECDDNAEEAVTKARQALVNAEAAAVRADEAEGADRRDGYRGGLYRKQQLVALQDRQRREIDLPGDFFLGKKEKIKPGFGEGQTPIFGLNTGVKQHFLYFLESVCYTEDNHTGGENMGWLLIPLLILVAIIAVAVYRNANVNYRTGSGMFKNSEYNLDDQDELSDKDYYNEEGLFK